MAINATADPVAPSAPTDPTGIRELMLANLFAVFSERDPERRLEVIARNYTEDVVSSDRTGRPQARGDERASAEAARTHAGFRVQRCRAGPRQPRPGLLAFNYGVPKQSPAASGVDVALVRDGRIALLYTLVDAQNDNS